ncbi:MAG TPA: right-handed parallel beta-helix repeat-containing protein, partial [Victivallales bacterium]|nr:right-handed parallel beta-helix repeat-containing protein [Victivallales bacterium]
YCKYSNLMITNCMIFSNNAYAGGGLYCSEGNPVLDNSSICSNYPDQINGSWTNAGGACVASLCTDDDGNGVPDECDGSTGDGVHEVPSEYPTIQDAIVAAGYGDTVLVGPGTYTGSNNYVINPSGKPITIRASGSATETILDGQGARCVVRCTSGEGSDTTIEGFTITGGYSNYGGGMYCADSSPTLSNCIITNNFANMDGGGLYLLNSNSSISGCLISNNEASNADGSAGGGGGVYCDSSSPMIFECDITNNAANGSSSQGGGINLLESHPTISNCAISENTAQDRAGGIYCKSSSPNIVDCLVEANSATTYPGGIMCYIDSSPAITNCRISYNSPSAIYSFANSTPALTNCLVCGNSPNLIQGDWTDNGGNTIEDLCPEDDGILEVPSEFDSIQDAIDASSNGDEILVGPGTYTGFGDAVINTVGKSITIRATGLAEETIIDGQNARRVVVCDSAEGNETVIRGFSITGGVAQSGGGVYCSNTSSPTIIGCTITGNSANGSYARGGGLYFEANSNPSISQCTITNNTSNSDGGGLAFSDSTPTITDCVITSNTNS